MSDLLILCRNTEPWIAVAGVSKYGDPGHDRQLLHELSPLPHVARITARVLVVHGEPTRMCRSARRCTSSPSCGGSGVRSRTFNSTVKSISTGRATSRLLLLREMVSFPGSVLPDLPGAGIPASAGLQRNAPTVL